MPPKKKAAGKADAKSDQPSVSLDQDSRISEDQAQYESLTEVQIKYYKNLRWSRMIKATGDIEFPLSTYSLLTDLSTNEDRPRYLSRGQRNKWQLIFDPDIFEKANPNLKMGDWQISDNNLKKWAIESSRLRQMFRAKALQYEEKRIQQGEDMNFKMSKLGHKIEKGWHKTPKGPLEKSTSAFYEETPIGNRLKGRRRPNLKIDDRLEIAHRIIVAQESQLDLAKEYRVSKASISHIIRKVRKSPEMLREATERQYRIQIQENEVAELIKDEIASGRLVMGAQDMQNKYLDQSRQKISLSRIKFVMKNHLSMGYTKIIQLAIQANSERAKVQRQQCALLFLKLLKSKKTFISIDESWIDNSDYRR